MIVHVVQVHLRGNPCPVSVVMESAAAARAAVGFVATTYLRKCPQDRAGAWQMGAESTQVDDAGVDVTQAPVAVFDPREIVAVHAIAREVGDAT